MAKTGRHMHESGVGRKEAESNTPIKVGKAASYDTGMNHESWMGGRGGEKNFSSFSKLYRELSVTSHRPVGM